MKEVIKHLDKCSRLYKEALKLSRESREASIKAQDYALEAELISIQLREWAGLLKAKGLLFQ